MNKNKNDDITQSDKQHHKQLVLIITILFIIMWMIILYIFQKQLLDYRYKFISTITVILPIVFMIYHMYIQNQIINESTSFSVESTRILTKIYSENRFAKIIPVIIFGMGILLSRFDTKYLRISMPFLILSLLFGTIIPFIIEHINFKQSSIDQILFFEIVEFCSESYAYSLLISSVLLPFVAL